MALPYLLVAWSLALAAEEGAPATGKVVEQVVAVVRSSAAGQARVITLTKLVEEARIALVSRGALEAATVPLDAAALRAALDWLVDQTILMEEAARLQVFEVDRVDVLSELKRFRGQFPTAPTYTAFLEINGLSEEELTAVLARMVRVQRYLDSRVRLKARVAEADIEDYYREHAADFSGRTLDSVRASIRSHLASERVRAEVREVVTDLRSRSDVRVLADFVGGGPVGTDP
jgi:hypothetical protein